MFLSSPTLAAVMSNLIPAFTFILVVFFRKGLFSTTSKPLFHPPLAGRLTVNEHDDETSSVFVLGNKSGALFVHAVANDLTISDILQPIYTHRKPLLRVQVMMLGDGIFIGCTINHVVGDGTSFWHFFNSLSEISHASTELSKPPTLERWFLDGINRPIRIRLSKATKEKENFDGYLNSQLQQQRVFHFSRDKIAELKAKANEMAS
ncbi:hypothetical protein K1719_042508 [Acacia pycnantha]|nr:hypothetical protein K1719_042508 [Acacia pycnantha]